MSDRLLEGEVEVVSFEDDLFRPCAARRDPLPPCDCRSAAKKASRSDDIDCTSFEVERVFDATHELVVSNRTAAAADTEAGNGIEQASNVKRSMWCQPPLLL